MFFALVGAGVGEFFPLEVSGISLKLRRFAQQKKNVDIIFVGSSRIYHGIDPKTFDQTMKANGHSWRSFNVGMDGMTTAEGFALVRRLLALHPGKLKYVFFEAQPAISAGTPTGDAQGKQRDVYWRDWPSIRSGFRIFAQGLTWPGGILPGTPLSVRRLEEFGPRFVATARLWFRNVTHVGSGMDLFEGAVDALPSHPSHRTPRKADRPNLPSDWNGYFAMSKPIAGETLATYRKTFAEVQDDVVKHAPDPMMRSELKRFAQEMAAKNVRVVFVVPPSLMAARGSGTHAPDGSPLFAYDDVARYPQFYEEDNRLDTEHLNARGAKIFSGKLAEDSCGALAPATR